MPWRGFILVCVLVGVPSVAQAAAGTDSLVGYWKFDEGSGSPADSSGSSLTGTMTGNATWTGSGATAISFTNTNSLSLDGNGDYVAFGQAAGLGVTNFTLSAWVYRTGAGTTTSTGSGGVTASPVLAKGRAQADGSNLDMNFFLGVDANLKIVSDFEDTATGGNHPVTGTTAITNDAWYHIAATFNGSTLQLYRNGTADGSISTTTVPRSDSIQHASVGSALTSVPAADGYFQGRIDDARVYNRALSATEIAELAAGTHPTATWDGSSSTNYETATNWDTNAIPDPYTRVVIADVSNDPAFTANVALNRLTINSGAVLDLDGFNLTINDGGTFINNGTFRPQGGETLTNFTNDTDTGTVIFDGTGTYSSGLNVGDAYNNLTFNGSGTWTLDAALDVNGGLTLTAGTLDVSAAGCSSASCAVAVGGNWSNSGTFTARTGTVTLDGTDQTIVGSTTFYNLAKSISSAATLTFTASTTQTISNTLTLTGASGQLLSLRSSSNGTQWNINPSGTRSIQYVDVKDSNNTNSTAIACSTGCTHSGNNTAWDFPQAAPGGFDGIAESANSIRWNWNDTSDDEDGFYLYDSSGNRLATIAANVGQHTEADLASNTAYSRYVTAFNTAGETAASATATVRTLSDPTSSNNSEPAPESSATPTPRLAVTATPSPTPVTTRARAVPVVPITTTTLIPRFQLAPNLELSEPVIIPYEGERTDEELQQLLPSPLSTPESLPPAPAEPGIVTVALRIITQWATAAASYLQSTSEQFLASLIEARRLALAVAAQRWDTFTQTLADGSRLAADWTTMSRDRVQLALTTAAQRAARTAGGAPFTGFEAGADTFLTALATSQQFANSALVSLREQTQQFLAQIDTASQQVGQTAETLMQQTRTRLAQLTPPLPTPDPKRNVPEHLKDHRYEEVNILIANASGQPLPGAQVTLFSEPKETVSNERGIASFSDVETGDHTIKIAYGGFRATQTLFLAQDAPKVLVAVNATFRRGMSPVAVAALLAAAIAATWFVSRRSQRA